MAAHTTFKVGGPADVWIRPLGESLPLYAAALLKEARGEGIPVFILGGGANLVVGDGGLRGIVLDTGGWTGTRNKEQVTSNKEWGEGPEKAAQESLIFRSGTRVDDAVDVLADMGLSGLEFLAGMPGTIGGAVWMNARCYERSVSDTLIETEILDEEFKRIWVPFRSEDFAYKKSPFQNREVLILQARFAVRARPEHEIRAEMEKHRNDREEKGHYRYPSAGSAFKNNHAFGKPAGKIIDELGLKGLRRGGAAIAPYHGNIVINTGNASAADIRLLMEETAARVRDALGIELESEIIFVGEF
jgi:UDP-N-acetylmuramate dehydrogenase